MYEMLKETLSLLKEVRTHSNTGGCVTKRLDQAIQNLEALKREKLSGPELSTSILMELGGVFSEFPEIQEAFSRLVER